MMEWRIRGRIEQAWASRPGIGHVAGSFPLGRHPHAASVIRAAGGPRAKATPQRPSTSPTLKSARPLSSTSRYPTRHGAHCSISTSSTSLSLSLLCRCPLCHHGQNPGRQRVPQQPRPRTLPLSSPPPHHQSPSPPPPPGPRRLAARVSHQGCLTVQRDSQITLSYPHRVSSPLLTRDHIADPLSLSETYQSHFLTCILYISRLRLTVRLQHEQLR